VKRSILHPTAQQGSWISLDPTKLTCEGYNERLNNTTPICNRNQTELGNQNCPRVGLIRPKSCPTNILL